MQITVLLFAHVADLIGKQSLTLELPEGATAKDALDTLENAHPTLSAMRSGLAMAIDNAYCGATTPLKDGQSLAIIPPVSGG